MLTLAITAAVGAAATATGIKLAGARRQAAELEAARARAASRLDSQRAQFSKFGADLADTADRLLAQETEDLDLHEAQLARDEEGAERRAARAAKREADVRAQQTELTERFEALKARRQTFGDESKALTALDTQTLDALEQVAGETREAVIHAVQDDEARVARLMATKRARQMEQAAELLAERDARHLIDTACQRYSCALPADRLTALVLLPKKAALLEQLLSGDREALVALGEAADVEISERNDTHLHVQGPDPFTRELGRLALHRMIKSGTVSPDAARSEVERARKDLDRIVRDAGRRAAKVLRLKPVDPEILYLVGKLLYRTSYTQNQWQHAIESAHLCGMMAPALGVPVQLARRAGLIHDIGKVLWAETEAVGSHAVSGAAFARAHGESDEVVHAIAAHHNDEKPSTALAHLVAAGDALSGARPGARRETIEAYSQRVEALEEICSRFRAIKGSMVIQGGRELRASVDPKELDDLAAAKLSAQLAEVIEEEMIYPGQIKVVVIRETRATTTARR